MFAGVAPGCVGAIMLSIVSMLECERASALAFVLVRANADVLSDVLHHPIRRLVGCLRGKVDQEGGQMRVRPQPRARPSLVTP
jgi:hypothetical protein